MSLNKYWWCRLLISHSIFRTGQEIWSSSQTCFVLNMMTPGTPWLKALKKRLLYDVLPKTFFQSWLRSFVVHVDLLSPPLESWSTDTLSGHVALTVTMEIFSNKPQSEWAPGNSFCPRSPFYFLFCFAGVLPSAHPLLRLGSMDILGSCWPINRDSEAGISWDFLQPFDICCRVSESSMHVKRRVHIAGISQAIQDLNNLTYKH